MTCVSVAQAVALGNHNYVSFFVFVNSFFMTFHARNESTVSNQCITSSDIAELLGENFSRFALYPDGVNRVVSVKTSATIPLQPSGRKQDIPLHDNGNECTEQEIQADVIPTAVKRAPFSFFRCLLRPLAASNPAVSEAFYTCTINFQTCRITPVDVKTTLKMEKAVYDQTNQIKVSPSTVSMRPSCVLKSVDTLPTITEKEKIYCPNNLLLFWCLRLNTRLVYRTKVVPVPGSWDETIRLNIHQLNELVSLELFDKDLGVNYTKLGGIRFNSIKLVPNVPYSTSVEFVVTLPKSVPLDLLLRLIESNQITNNCLNQNGLDKFNIASYDTDSIVTHTSQCVRVEAFVTLSIQRNSTVSPFWGHVALSSIPLTCDVQVTSTPNFHFVYNLLRYIKFCAWDSTALEIITTLSRFTYCFKSFKEISLVIVIWSFFCYPSFCISSLFLFCTLLYWCLPWILPPLRRQSFHTMKAENKPIPYKFLNSGGPTIFFKQFITPQLLKEFVVFQDVLIRIAQVTETFCYNLRDPFWFHRYMIVALGFSLSYISLNFPYYFQLAASYIFSITTGGVLMAPLLPFVMFFYRVIKSFITVLRINDSPTIFETF
ncbi:uncharacterized protein LOC128883078 isoform X2 [Hylaeus volcanicus]|uniref:uncharacterized protein LOC128883078 isoform X2 n=1 Tax=Hylaeus volcanicus TaxID=313075 RepID=UPI0023B83E1C|nr:uncharacterized protein LOC128883078 isoform X2 [Hylaeus volcanicus]